MRVSLIGGRSACCTPLKLASMSNSKNVILQNYNVLDHIGLLFFEPFLCISVLQPTLTPFLSVGDCRISPTIERGFNCRRIIPIFRGNYIDTDSYPIEFATSTPLNIGLITLDFDVLVLLACSTFNLKTNEGITHRCDHPEKAKKRVRIYWAPGQRSSQK